MFDLTVEHFIYGGDALLNYTNSIILAIFESGIVPDMIKEGLLSPVFKNMGSILDIKNYRGITVLPVFEKIVESILKNRVRPECDKQQCSIQRGFTQNSAPINSSFILEESRREALDLEQRFIIILLDAKSAFDVVVHQSMMRRLYHLGLQDKHWTLINSLHSNASSAVKFNGLVSDTFEIQQGIRHGGVLSADLYKIYVDPLLHRLKHSGLGMKIGNIQCAASACADDIAINSTNLEEAQILLNMAYDYSCKEHYKLQPQKSVVIDISSQKREEKVHQFNCNSMDLIYQT